MSTGASGCGSVHTRRGATREALPDVVRGVSVPRRVSRRGGTAAGMPRLRQPGGGTTRQSPSRRRRIDRHPRRGAPRSRRRAEAGRHGAAHPGRGTASRRDFQVHDLVSEHGAGIAERLGDILFLKLRIVGEQLFRALDRDSVSPGSISCDACRTLPAPRRSRRLALVGAAHLMP
jgi:hypothetical protein